MRVVIIGAGIAGLALANRMARLGWEVVVLEKSAGPRAQGYMMDFFGPGYDAVEAMGALPRVRELGYRVSEATYVDDGGRRRAGLSFARFAQAMDGRLVSIMRPDLERALREQLPEAVDLRYGSTLSAVDELDDRVRITLTNGDRLDADLLVGADGIHSTVRELVFGREGEFLRYLGFHTAAFRISDPEIHARVADQFCLTDTVDRQLGCYGLRDGTVAVFTVHRTADPAMPRDVRSDLREVYGSLGWLVPRALDQCPPSAEVYYDQIAQIEMPRWSSGRVTLVGDACQAVSLLAGQGASLAIAGAYVLADHVTRADSIAAGLAGYERLWRPVIAEKQAVARKGTRWFLPDTRLRLRARQVAMKLAHLPIFDRVVAAALAGKPVALSQRLPEAGQRVSTKPLDRA